MRSSKVTQFKKIICWLEQDGLSQKVRVWIPVPEFFTKSLFKYLNHHFTEKSNCFNVEDVYGWELSWVQDVAFENVWKCYFTQSKKCSAAVVASIITFASIKIIESSNFVENHRFMFKIYSVGSKLAWLFLNRFLFGTWQWMFLCSSISKSCLRSIFVRRCSSLKRGACEVKTDGTFEKVKQREWEKERVRKKEGERERSER